jgi:putative hemolysin
MSDSTASVSELPLIDFDFAGLPEVRFSYAGEGDTFWRRCFIRSIEFFTGQPYLRRRYLEWVNKGVTNETIFAAGLRLLGIELDINGQALSGVPRKGPLLVVANHPYGVADGLALGDLLTRLRPDTKIMTHSLLCQPPEAARYLLPVDFGGTAAARDRSARTRREAVEWLQAGHCVALFPAGGVATRQNPLKGPALDLPWHSFAGRLAAVPGAQVLPLYFHGQNSMLFHVASHAYYPARIALMFRETMRRRGKALRVTVGQVLGREDLPVGEGRRAVADHLRKATFALAGDSNASTAAYVWPKHVSF